MSANPDFVDELAKNIIIKEAKVIFICRSNNRSKIAASIAESAGYTDVSFVLDGFEGSNYGPGWKNSDLPCE
jgi:rhodanese-related sulfurtransferase